MAEQILEIDRSTYDHYNKDKLIYKSNPGLTKEIVEENFARASREEIV